MEMVTISKEEYEELKRKAGVADMETGGFQYDKEAGFIGMWADREDMKDSVAWVNAQRKKQDDRSPHGDHAAETQ